jgi:predicted N-acyltransferase
VAHDAFADALASVATHGDPFISTAFLGGIEALNLQQRHPALRWPAAHLVLNDAQGPAAVLPRYLRQHSFGDFSRDWGWADAWQQAGVAYYPKFVSGVPYTPSPGPRLLVRPDLDHAEWALRLARQAIAEVDAGAASSWQVLFVDEADREVLQSAGCLMRRGVQFHWISPGWRDFDDFLASFSAEKRKKLKRERRSVAESGLRIETRHGDEIDAALWAQLHPLYADTFLRFGNHPALSEEFFAHVGSALGRQMVVFIAWDGAEVAACAICYRDAETLYGRHWGSRVTVSGLHFELCYYQGIEYCLREGLNRFEPGAQGEHKLARGFVPSDTWCAYWIGEPRLRHAVADYLAREAQAIATYAEESALRLPFKAP